MRLASVGDTGVKIDETPDPARLLAAENAKIARTKIRSKSPVTGVRDAIAGSVCPA